MKHAKKHILVVDDSRSVRAFFEDIFSKKKDYLAEFAASGEEAIEIFKNNLASGGPRFNFVLTDINMPGLDGFGTIEAIKKADPDAKVGMITGFNVDDYIKMALERGVYNIICKMDAPADIIKTIDNLITGSNIFGIESHLEGSREIKTVKITETRMLKTAVQEILDYSADYLDEDKIYGLKTGLVEMGTNAIYHAYGYEKGSNVKLKENEEVYISYGIDSEKLVVLILDASGSLSKEKVLAQLNKGVNPTPEDLIASGGRGIYLTRYLCDKVVVNIEPDKKTEVILIMYFKKDYIDGKPLLINQI
ncbi:MAG: response regulator [bacterium]